MKAFYILLSALIALFLATGSPGQAQPTLTVYHDFADASAGTNFDGADSVGGLVLVGTKLFGAGYLAGPATTGTIFSINKDGSSFSVVHAFSAPMPNTKLFQETNTDGGLPGTGLLVSGSALYGVCSFYGAFGYGTFFSIDADTSTFTDLSDFQGGSTGQFPFTTPATDGHNFYSTAIQQGIYNSGAIFEIVGGSGPPVVTYSFSASGASNFDGIEPYGSLLPVGETLYGCAYSGGAANSGTIYSVDVSGADFLTLHALNNASPAFEGKSPGGTLTLIGNKLYGSASQGGMYNNGTLFSVDTNGSNFTILHTFGAASGSASTNADGSAPQDGFTYTNGTLYGTAKLGGPGGGGTVFSMGLDGGNFTVLYGFTLTSGSQANFGGCGPNQGLVVDDNDIYGATVQGGAYGSGTIFHLSLAPALPQLSTARTGMNLVISWPAIFSNYTLQSSANLGSSSSWSTVTPGPVMVNGQNTVTNFVTGAERFFRLVSNGH